MTYQLVSMTCARLPGCPQNATHRRTVTTKPRAPPCRGLLKLAGDPDIGDSRTESKAMRQVSKGKPWGWKLMEKHYGSAEVRWEDVRSVSQASSQSKAAGGKLPTAGRQSLRPEFGA